MQHYFNKKLDDAERQAQLMQQKIDSFPYGYLSKRKNGKYHKWYLVTDGESSKSKRFLKIPSKDKDFIANMAMKNVYLCELESLTSYQKLINSFISQLQEFASFQKSLQTDQLFYSEIVHQYNKRMLNQKKKRRRKRDSVPTDGSNPNPSSQKSKHDLPSGTTFDKVLPDFAASTNLQSIKFHNNLWHGNNNFDSKEIIDNWINTPYQILDRNNENKKIHTLSGILVRSKSEALIADALYRNNIPFRYECELILINGQRVYPDFTIFCPWNQKIYYWEHFGMMDNLNYREKAYKKLAEYGNNNIIPNINMIATFETLECPLSSNLVESIIMNFFR